MLSFKCLCSALSICSSLKAKVPPKEGTLKSSSTKPKDVVLYELELGTVKSNVGKFVILSSYY
ncbi:hypothetical protein PIROE2DRAFT_1919 [Piromyces sp. E2]|nr:hypothetical protein PIROE2DRAFT_1919 [Piromyces sp. E2]|eukprot:OUM69982.1 hypothetical protein PIROE2DRAFT_1919 [Piromyces sp. E2]